VTQAPDDDTSPAEVDATRRDVDRVVAFSDGVFAIAITLLILSIDVPDVNPDRLGHALRELLPEVGTYALSFLVVGMYWLAHHRTFRSVRAVNRTLLWINLVLLGFVAVLPLPTEILGKYGDTTLATVVYASAIVAVGGMSVLIWWYLNHAGLTAPISEDLVRLGSLRAAIPPAVFAVSIPIAFVDPGVAKIFWIAIWPANALVEHKYGADAYGP
jgi:TMEM175 potassium channel family protein